MTAKLWLNLLKKNFFSTFCDKYCWILEDGNGRLPRKFCNKLPFYAAQYPKTTLISNKNLFRHPLIEVTDLYSSAYLIQWKRRDIRHA